MTIISKRLAAISVAAGLALGAFSILADGIIPWQPITILGNLASPWALVAFVVGRFASTRKQGSVAATAALVMGVLSYYIRAVLAGYFSPSGNLLWAGVAIVLGPILGGAGAASKERPAPIWSIATPSALLLAESLFFLYDRRIWLWDFVDRPALFLDLSVVVLMLAVAVALPLRLERDHDRQHQAFWLTAWVGAVGAVGYYLFFGLFVAS